LLILETGKFYDGSIPLWETRKERCSLASEEDPQPSLSSVVK